MDFVARPFGKIAAGAAPLQRRLLERACAKRLGIRQLDVAGDLVEGTGDVEFIHVVR